MGADNTDLDSQPPSNKVDRVIKKYGLDRMGPELEDRWLGVDGEQASTRTLADRFNKRVLKSAVEESDAFTLSGDVSELYRALTDESTTDATLVQSRLEQSGIDVNSVTNDFVSHQTIYRYLKNHRGVEQPEQTPEDQTQKAIEAIQRLRGRTTAVTGQTVENLKRKDAVSVGDFSILNDLQILCENCGRSDDVATFLERGGCTCQIGDEDS